MNYMMLIHHDDAALAKANQKELWAITRPSMMHSRRRGGRSGVRLKPASAATSVRVRDGKTEIIDGPMQIPKKSLRATL